MDIGYALINFSTNNLGDHIQSIAARQFLPRVDVNLDRERLCFDPGTKFQKLKIIMNGWFMRMPLRWPPHEKLDPLLISMHLNPLWRPLLRGRLRLIPPATKFLLRHKNVSYFREHGPVGARDTETLGILQQHGVDSYLSSCLTLTLKRDEGAVRGDYVVATDLDLMSRFRNDEIMGLLKQRVGKRLVTTTHVVDDNLAYDRKMEMAADLLRLYSGACCVITTRLHCALPCLALNTPVLLVKPQRRIINRFEGLLSLLRHCSRDEFLAGKVPMDLFEPQPNSNEYLKFREALSLQCRQFVEN